MAPDTAFIVLFCVATTVAMAVRRYKVPYTVALVVAGLGIGARQLIEAPHAIHGITVQLVARGAVAAREYLVC